ncbi:MAG: Uma2 family endonuclease [Thiohalocapsa sp.]
MTEIASKQHLTVDDYLAVEDGSDMRHEHIGGEVYALTGASDRHGLITLNIASCLRPLLRGINCQIFANDMKVRLSISRQDIFYYPDLLVSCDPADRETYYRSKPGLIIEVLSESTERIDRRGKLFAYQTIPSLQEYLLVSQDQRELQIHRRADGWAPECITEDSVQLNCLSFDLPLDIAYEDVLEGCEPRGIPQIMTPPSF